MKALDKQDTGYMQTIKSTWRSVLLLKCICGNNNALSLKWPRSESSHSITTCSFLSPYFLFFIFLLLPIWSPNCSRTSRFRQLGSAFRLIFPFVFCFYFFLFLSCLDADADMCKEGCEPGFPASASGRWARLSCTPGSVLCHCL